MKSIKRIELHCVREAVGEYNRILTASRHVAKLLTDLQGKYDCERMLVLCMDAKNRVVAFNVAAVGGVAACAVEPRDVFRAAVVAGAVAVIVAHNHPSGDAAPSQADVEITKRLVSAGTVLGIHVLDHVITTHDAHNYFSFADAGALHG